MPDLDTYKLAMISAAWLTEDNQTQGESERVYLFKEDAI